MKKVESLRKRRKQEERTESEKKHGQSQRGMEKRVNEGKGF